jgi:hypothetical protein
MDKIIPSLPSRLLPLCAGLVGLQLLLFGLIDQNFNLLPIGSYYQNKFSSP